MKFRNLSPSDIALLAKRVSESERFAFFSSAFEIPKFSRDVKLRTFMILDHQRHKTPDKSRIKKEMRSLVNSSLATSLKFKDFETIFFLFFLSQRTKELDHSSSKEYDIQKSLRRVRQVEKRTVGYLRRFFGNILSATSNVQNDFGDFEFHSSKTDFNYSSTSIFSVLTSLVENEDICTKMYEKLLQDNPTNVTLLRGYGRFLQDIRGDHLLGEAYLNSANMIEGGVGNHDSENEKFHHHNHSERSLSHSEKKSVTKSGFSS